MRIAACAALVAALAALNFLARPNAPTGLVWDEGYYVTSTQRYQDGRAQFGTHPPLGLMLLAAGDAWLQPNAALDTSALGNTKHVTGEALPPGYSLIGMRIASGVAATLSALVLFALVLTVTGSPPAALVAANLFVFDTALVTHLRPAHLDAFQLLFTLLALWAFVGAALRGRRNGWHEIGLGAAGALAMLVKLNAAWLLVLAAAWLLQLTTRHWRQGRNVALRQAGLAALRMLGAGLLVTLLVLTAHVAIGHRLPNPATIAGRQDAAFIRGEYRRYLQGERTLGLPVLGDAARDYVRFMRVEVRGVGLHDANGSTPWQWMLGQSTINYRWDSDGTRTSYVQLLPNPAGWMLAALAPLAMCLLLGLAWVKPLPPDSGTLSAWIPAALLTAWLACFALHLWIASQRVMYLYHAFSGLLLGFVLAVLAWRMAVERWPSLRRGQTGVVAAFVALHLTAFLWLSPLALHRPLDHAACERRNLMQHIVACRP